MNRFSSHCCIAHCYADARDCVQGLLRAAPKVLFIGTVGIDANSLYYPMLLADTPNVEFRFIVEQRPNVSASLIELGDRHRAFLEHEIDRSRRYFHDVSIISEDGATVAGRNAVRTAEPWFQSGLTDIVIDATGMSRGTCFPIVRQACQIGIESGANVHLLVASSDHRTLKLRTESNDRADWLHGFQGEMGTDQMSDAFKLWVPQLTEGAGNQMNAIFSELMPTAEVCPIIPFPSSNPRRGDELLFEYSDVLSGRWDSSPLNLIYAHESDPLDVFRSITRMSVARSHVFIGHQERAVTVLSPAGWRIGSLGMLLAAIDLELPILYVETIGYNSASGVSKSVAVPDPDHMWHIWLAGAPYANEP